MSAYQHTIAKRVQCAGIGLHSGTRARMVMTPAPAGHGIRFKRADLEGTNAVPADARFVSHVELGTTLEGPDGASVAVVEHLMAALSGLGIDNLLVELDGPEVPVMDGSSAVFVDLLTEAGILAQASLRRRLRILRPVRVEEGEKFAELSPAVGSALRLRARIDFDNEVIGVQELAFCLTPERFASDIADARTFGFYNEVEYLKSKGLARGGSLDNAVVIGAGGLMNPEGLRMTDEFVRHKLLDAVGDLALAGAPIAGAYSANQPGHALNNKLVRALLADRGAWCMETGAPVRTAAAQRPPLLQEAALRPS